MSSVADYGDDGETGRTEMDANDQLGPTRLPRDSQVEQGAEVSRVQMLAGLRAYERSDMRRIPTVHRFPVLDLEASALSWRSFSITAAGQPRRFAGFPFEPLAEARSTNMTTTYCGSTHKSTKMQGSPEHASGP